MKALLYTSINVKVTSRNELFKKRCSLELLAIHNQYAGIFYLNDMWISDSTFFIIAKYKKHEKFRR